MSLPVFLRPEAEADLKAAKHWHEQQRTGLGEPFIQAVDALLERVGAMPELYAVVLNGVRRAKLRRPVPAVLPHPPRSRRGHRGAARPPGSARLAGPNVIC